MAGKGKQDNDSDIEEQELRSRLKRKGQELREKTKIPDEPVKVSSGMVDNLTSLVFNATREKIREVTIVDRFQGRLLPQLDIMALTWKNCVEIASFRQDFKRFPVDHGGRIVPDDKDLIDEFIYRTAQWQKSIAGKSLDRALDLSLAEIEAGNDDKDYYGERSGISEK